MTDGPFTPERRAAAFRKTRTAHLSEVAEDYVELIGDLIAERGEARVTDVAEHMGVSHATVAKVVGRLRREGLVAGERYRSLFLTDQGRAIAADSRRRHQVVHDFLLALGLPERVAEADAEGIEHHVSDETLTALLTLTEQLRRSEVDAIVDRATK
jgi:DtxR family transcriptional regulator, manganese transport regulator